MGNAILDDRTPIDAETGRRIKLYPGTKIRVSISIYNASDALVNDSSLVLYIQAPSAATATEIPHGSLTNPSTGAYYYEYTAQEGGEYFFRWAAASPNFGADEFKVRVQHSQLTLPSP